MKGVQDALRRLDGTGTVRVDLQTNLVTLAPDPRVELDLAAIPAVIRSAGFTPADMRLVARGAFGARDGAPVFRIRGWSTDLPVRGPVPAAGEAGAEVRLEAAVDFADGVWLVLD